MFIGVAAGLLAALFQSVGFVLSRLTSQRYGASAITVLFFSHIIMALMSLLLIPFLSLERLPALRPCLLPLLGASSFYLMGIACFFQAIKKIDSSRATPLLGMKVVFVALLSIVFLKTSFSLWQWISIAMTLVAAAFLNHSGSKIPWRSAALAIFAAFMYACSDLFIRDLILAFSDLGSIKASIFACCLNFLICGVAGVIVFFFLPNKTNKKVWKGSLLFSLAFFSANFLVFIAIAKSNVVYANIAMSTRGIISILLGAFLASLGIHDLETKAASKVILSRVLAGSMMTFAIYLFSFDN